MRPEKPVNMRKKWKVDTGFSACSKNIAISRTNSVIMQEHKRNIEQKMLAVDVMPRIEIVDTVNMKSKLCMLNELIYRACFRFESIQEIPF